MVVCVSLKVDNVWTTMPLGTSNFTVLAGTNKNLDVDTKYYTAAHQNNSKTALYIIECSIYTEAGKLKKSTSFMIAWDKE